MGMGVHRTRHLHPFLAVPDVCFLRADAVSLVGAEGARRHSRRTEVHSECIHQYGAQLGAAGSGI